MNLLRLRRSAPELRIWGERRVVNKTIVQDTLLRENVTVPLNDDL